MSVKVSKKEIQIGRRVDGSRYVLNVMQYKGPPGPSVFIGVGLHGDELTGNASVWKLIEYLDGKDVRGTITIMPGMNPEGMNYNIRGIPEDVIDLNRLFPGKADGHVSERLTAKIWEIARKHDIIVDLHTIGRGIPFVILDPVTGDLKRRTDELADATGITVLDEFSSEDYAQQNLGASLGGAATKENIPSLTIELGGSKDIDWSTADAGYLAVRNVLVHVGCVKGTLTPVKSSPVIREKGYRREVVWSEKNGLVEYVVDIGEKVKAGKVLAKVKGLYGDVLEEVRMPKDGYLIAQNPSHVTHTGGYIATIAIRKE